MENKCHFVNSRGLLKSCHFHAAKPISSSSTNKFYLKEMVKRKKCLITCLFIFAQK
jgi:hypothetical protein